ncbi:signal peptidase I [Carnobacteriaceae bacterium zg-ZUI252]|nr:signal peptidase I [Carnobacteriaceae bacterium zg-ZUI252]MBS4769894.1 signal peptidase I [Carnobacteriaceae bacterium zg-ZUI240]QTU83303.1 signal peptidase I [Carnobacteriaceae bacterium zg-C25]
MMNKRKPIKEQTVESIIKQRLKRLRDKEDISRFFKHLILLLGSVYLLFGFVFGLSSVPNDEMMPRMSAGDIFLYYRLEKSVRSGDVIYFEKDDKYYLGRVIATVGEKVEITKDNRVKVNDSLLTENYIYQTTAQYDSDVTYPLQLSNEEVFVLVDYREGGKDSRYFGPVNIHSIKGKIITILRKSNI